MNNNYDGRFGELAHQSTVVIQCTHDQKDMINRTKVKPEDVFTFEGKGPTLEPSVTRIDVGDLVFQCGTSRQPRATMLNNAIPAISCLNGLYIPKNRAPSLKHVQEPKPGEDREHFERLLNQTLSESIRFLGIALNPTVPNPEREEEQTTQFTVRTQGTGKVFHNGDALIYPGQILLWDLPTRKEVTSKKYRERNTRFGYGEEKVTLKIVPLDEATTNYNSAFIEALTINDDTEELKLKGTAAGQYGSKLKEFIQFILFSVIKKTWNKSKTIPCNFEDFKANKDSKWEIFLKTLIGDKDDAKELYKYAQVALQAFMNVHFDIERRKIGKALSYAKPGSQIDVLFGTD